MNQSIGSLSIWKFSIVIVAILITVGFIANRFGKSEKA